MYKIAVAEMHINIYPLFVQLRSVFATFRINALFLQHEPRYGFATQQVGVNDLVNVLSAYTAVPDRVRVDHNIWSMFALVEASGCVGTEAGLQSQCFELFLELLLQLALPAGIATSARTGGVALITADEDVFFKFRHCHHYPRCSTA
jgi:hypothetical protein